MSHISSTSQSRRRVVSSSSYQPLVVPSTSQASTSAASSRRSPRVSSSSELFSAPSPSSYDQPRSRRSARQQDGWESTAAASESGMSAFSVLSAFPPAGHRHHGEHRRTRNETDAERRERKAKRRLEKERTSSKFLEPVRGRDGTAHGSAEGEHGVEPRDPTDSPLRRSLKWIIALLSGQKRHLVVLISISLVVLVKWSVGLGGYSGFASPPLRGDFEAQRHWISLTSSSLSRLGSIKIPFTRLSIPLHHPPWPSYTSGIENDTSSSVVPLSEWYTHDLQYWGLDYPPLTAYHSYLIGFIARWSANTARFVTLRPPMATTNSSSTAEWEETMRAMELEGQGPDQRSRGQVTLKDFMRATVVVGDLIVWVTAVAWYCWWNFGRTDSLAVASESNLDGHGRERARDDPIRKQKSSERALRRTLVAALTILLQPALILIDNGHFQYNSIMLGLTLWAINAFQSGHDLAGSILFVASLGFKQMALYYAPGVFAYLLGKCLWLGGRDGLNMFLHLGLTVAISFAVVFAPFLSPFPSALAQAIQRIFPFARGLFEDKVANAWCALNVVVKLRTLASVATLARVSLVVTLLAVLPSTVGVMWISYRLGRQEERSQRKQKKKDGVTVPSSNRGAAFSSSASSSSRTTNDLPDSRFIDDAAAGSGKAANLPAPTSHLLPHLLATSALSFFLFSFQVHEKSILLPLMPLTLLMGAREKGYGRLDWEWGVLLNNVAVFSMYPLLKKDGLTTQYFTLTLFWNFLIGYNPLKLRQGSVVKLLSLSAYGSICLLHVLELVTDPPAHLPDLFAVLNLTLSAGVFGLGWLWVGKRLAQETWAIGGF